MCQSGRSGGRAPIANSAVAGAERFGMVPPLKWRLRLMATSPVEATKPWPAHGFPRASMNRDDAPACCPAGYVELPTGSNLKVRLAITSRTTPTPARTAKSGHT